MKKWVIALLPVLVLSLCGMFYSQRNTEQNEQVVVTEYTVSDSKIPEKMDGYQILLISDLHNAPFAPQICKQIRERQPDCILLAGDLIQLPYDDPQKDMENVWAVLDQVADEIPTYFVSGNHETGTGNYYRIYEALKDHGAVSLEDRARRLWKNGASIRIIGLEDPGADLIRPEDRQEMLDTLDRLLEEEAEEYTILLCHRSNAFSFLRDTPVDLVLSGHMHGGVIRLPFLGGVVGNDGEDFFPAYDYGMFQEEGTVMIVSGGCDKNPKKMRINNPPELVLVTLRHGA